MITTWYVVVGKPTKERVSNYPLSIYADKELADEVAKANNEIVQPVQASSLPYDPKCLVPIVP
jgi:hypothetical protein